jgi:glyoxylase-like metal-dependent hydrolase (beta-lactamase superfamily II)
MREDELKDLGIFRIPLPIPFAQAGGPVNAYVIEDEHGVMLFDAGIGTEKAHAALVDSLAQTGHSWQDVNRIILSHGHIDHYGAAAWILERIGKTIPVLIHNRDSDKILESGWGLPFMLNQNRSYLLNLGIPLRVFEGMIAAIGREAGMGKRLACVAPLLPGEKFRCKHVELEVLHMPGHTPGLCCLYDRGHRISFSSACRPTRL